MMSTMEAMTDLVSMLGVALGGVSVWGLCRHGGCVPPAQEARLRPEFSPLTPQSLSFRPPPAPPLCTQPLRAA